MVGSVSGIRGWAYQLDATQASRQDYLRRDPFQTFRLAAICASGPVSKIILPQISLSPQ